MQPLSPLVLVHAAGERQMYGKCFLPMTGRRKGSGRSASGVLQSQTRKREHSRKPDEQYELDRGVQFRTLPRAFCARRTKRLDQLGPPGRQRLRPNMEDLPLQLGSRRGIT